MERRTDASWNHARRSVQYTIGEVDASWYATKDIYGNVNRVVFLRNSGNNPVIARSSNSLYGDERGYSRCILSPGDEGILLLKGDDGVSDIQVTDYADSAVKANDLSWSILDKDGSNYIKIESASGKDILLNANALTVATRGATVSTASCNLYSGEKLHSGDRIRIDSMVQHMSLGTDLVINDNIDVFINGVRIPRAEPRP